MPPHKRSGIFYLLKAVKLFMVPGYPRPNHPWPHPARGFDIAEQGPVTLSKIDFLKA